MPILLGVMLAAVALPPLPAVIPKASDGRQVTFDAAPDLQHFYGIPLNLTFNQLKRLPYRVKTETAFFEEERYTRYFITAERKAQVEVFFDAQNRLTGLSTDSPIAVGPKGIGVGSRLSAVKSAWPEGRLFYGVEENRAFVSYRTNADISYYFDPKEMPAQAFDWDWEKSRAIEVPNIRVKSMSLDLSHIPNADYGFLSLPAELCAASAGAESRQIPECKRLTEPRRFRGTVVADKQNAFFAPVGKPICVHGKPSANCHRVIGKADDTLMLIQPTMPAACPEASQVTLIGRPRSLPDPDGGYAIEVDEVYSLWGLPKPPHEQGTCDERAW